jgi:hypothetical protein
MKDSPSSCIYFLNWTKEQKIYPTVPKGWTWTKYSFLYATSAPSIVFLPHSIFAAILCPEHHRN